MKGVGSNPNQNLFTFSEIYAFMLSEFALSNQYELLYTLFYLTCMTYSVRIICHEHALDNFSARLKIQPSYRYSLFVSIVS